MEMLEASREASLAWRRDEDCRGMFFRQLSPSARPRMTVEHSRRARAPATTPSTVIVQLIYNWPREGYFQSMTMSASSVMPATY